MIVKSKTLILQQTIENESKRLGIRNVENGTLGGASGEMRTKGWEFGMWKIKRYEEHLGGKDQELAI